MGRSTGLAPEVFDDVVVTPDIEAWLRGEVEMPCTVVKIFFFMGMEYERKPCKRKANWMALWRMFCRHPGGPEFLCNRHKRDAERGRISCAYSPGPGRPGGCPAPQVTYIERITKRWWQ